MGQCNSVRGAFLSEEEAVAAELAALEVQGKIPVFSTVEQGSLAGSGDPDDGGEWAHTEGRFRPWDTMVTENGGQVVREFERPCTFVVYASHEMNVPTADGYRSASDRDNACVLRAAQLGRAACAKSRVGEGLRKEVSEVWRAWKAVDDPTPPVNRFAVAAVVFVIRVTPKKEEADE